MLSSGCHYGPGAPALHRPHPGTHREPGQAQTWDTQGPGTHRDPGHTQGSSTGTPRQLLCRLLHMKPRGQRGRSQPGAVAGPVSSGPRTRGHRHARFVTPQGHRHARGGTQVTSRWCCPHHSLAGSRGTQERGQNPGSDQGWQGPGSARSPRGCCGAPAPSRDHLNTTAQGHRLQMETPWTPSARSGSSGCGSGLGRGCAGAQEPLRSIILGVPVTECWVQDGAQKSI